MLLLSSSQRLCRSDENGVHSALYDDMNCQHKVSGTDDVWDSAPMNTCTGKDGYSVYPVCETSLQHNVQYLSHTTGYMADGNCTDESQVVSEQFFVTDQCFALEDGKSRQQFCAAEGSAILRLRFSLFTKWVIRCGFLLLRQR